MRALLKKIQIDNFKSFEDLTIVDNLKAFNIVAGNNGSGKSNFMDAIAFCFGEVKAKLRVKNYADLAFASEHSLDNEIFVACTFECQDKSLLTFKRIIYKNRCTYVINDREVSKEKYQNQLKEIGINLKARNFIIYQGEQNELMMESAKQRTVRFEEISESIQYKKEYDRLNKEIENDKKFLKKKNDEKLVLLRKRKHEINCQKECETVLQLQKNYDETELLLVLLNLRITEIELNEAEEELKKLVKEKNALKTKKNHDNDELRSKKNALDIEEKNLIDVKLQIMDTKDKIFNSTKNLDTTKNNMYSIEKKIDIAKQFLEKSKNAVQSQRNAIKDLEIQYNEIEQQKNEYLKEFSQKFDQGGYAENEKEYHALRDKVSAKTIYLVNELDLIKQQQKKFLITHSDNNRKIIKSENEIKRIDELIEKYRSFRENRRENEEAFRNKTENYKRQYKEARESFDLLDREIKRAEVELDRIQKQLQRWRDYKADLEKSKEEETIEYLQNMMSTGVYGRLSEFCKPKHQRYAACLGKVMGNFASAIIVDNRKTATACIGLLKNEQRGRAIFLPLDSLAIPKIKDSLRNSEMFEGIQNVKLFIDVVKYPSEVKNAVQYALKDILVCETPRDANHVAYNLSSNQKYNCVALDGTYYKKNGNISGGTQCTERRVSLGGIPDKDQLKDQRIKLLNQIMNFKKRQDELNLFELENKIRCFENLLNSQQNESSQDSDNRETENELLERIERLEAELVPLMNEKETIEKELKVLEKNAAKVEKHIKTIEKEIFAKFCEKLNINDVSQFRNSITKFEELRLKNSEYSKHLITIQQQLDIERNTDTQSNVLKYTRKVNDLKEELKAQDRHANLQAEINENNSVLKSLEEQYEIIYSAKQQLYTEVNDLNNNIDKYHEDFQINTQSFKRHLNTFNMLLKKYVELLDDAKVNNIKLPFLQGSYDSLDALNDNAYDESSLKALQKKRNSLNIKLQYNSVLHNDDTIENLNAKVENLKEKLAKLDDEISSYGLLRQGSQELDDINKKLAAVKEAIKEIQKQILNNTTQFKTVAKQRTDTFMNTFDAIAEATKKIYEKLSGNEHCHAFLNVSKLEEPFAGEVYYYCVPPGKRFVHSHDLSGGEKTIATLALIFAIMQANTSSILLLDEVDAPLDGGRFQNTVKYIKKLGDSHQIIYITLNKDMFVYANVLLTINPTITKCRKVAPIINFELDKYLESISNQH